MTGKLLRPQPMQEIARLRRQVMDLRRRVGVSPTQPLRQVPEDGKEFSWYGPLEASESGPFSPKYGGRMRQVVFLLQIAGTEDTIVRAKKNGVAITPRSSTGTIAGTDITIPAGATRISASYPDNFSPDVDLASFEVVTAGTAAESLTIQARWS